MVSSYSAQVTFSTRAKSKHVYSGFLSPIALALCWQRWQLEDADNIVKRIPGLPMTLAKQRLRHRLMMIG